MTERFGYLTAEAPFDVAQGRLRARSREFLIKSYSELCELGVSVVKYDLLYWLRLCRTASLR